jgi:hypothetical protein
LVARRRPRADTCYNDFLMCDLRHPRFRCSGFGSTASYDYYYGYTIPMPVDA